MTLSGYPVKILAKNGPIRLIKYKTYKFQSRHFPVKIKILGGFFSDQKEE